MLKYLALILFAGPALADVQAIVGLPPPASIYVPGHTTCAAAGFAVDDSVFGTCKTAVSGACSGRGCSPVTNTTFYIVNWTISTTATFGVVATAGDACYSVRHHLPQADAYTYLNGHTRADCPFLLDNNNVIEVPYGGFDYPYWYVSASADGVYELANSNVGSVLIKF